MYTCIYMYIHMCTHTTYNILTLQNTLSFHILLDTPKAGIKINLYLIDEEIKAQGSYIMCSRNRPETWLLGLLNLKDDFFLGCGEKERRSIHQPFPTHCEALRHPCGCWWRFGAVSSFPLTPAYFGTQVIPAISTQGIHGASQPSKVYREPSQNEGNTRFWSLAGLGANHQHTSQLSDAGQVFPDRLWKSQLYV